MKGWTGKIAVILFALFLFPLNAAAAGITSSSYNASDDLFYVYMDLTGVESFNLEHAETGERQSFPVSSQNYISLNCNGTYYFTFYNSSNVSMGSDSVVSSGIQSESSICDTSTPTPTPEEPAKTCDSCAIMECPGWSDYMGKLDGIAAAIPPPTDWQAVAETFRDTIAPQFKQDMQDVLGSAPPPPSIATGPSLTQPNVAAPTAPPSLGGVDDNGLTAPTGQEAPGLGESGFSSDDIKDEAPVIPERTDPTGGFTFSDPIGGLPSQEEFISNTPIEEPATFPAPPILDPGGIVTEPTFEEPTFTEPTFEEPTFTDPIIGGPSIDFDSTPIPSNAPTTEPAPTPGEPTFTGPTIDYDTAPIPGGDGSTAPMPGG